MSSTRKETSEILKRLGLSSANDAALVLNELVQGKVITLDQIRNIQKAKLKPPKQQQNGATSSIDRYLTRHIALRFHYDGATYNGLAQNVNAPDDNSVEKTLFAALQKTCLITSRSECGYSRSGRTDKGVSAFGQVVALRVRSAFPKGTLTLAGYQTKRELTEVDLPKNSMEKLKCLVPAKQKKRKKNSHHDGGPTPTNIEQKMVEKELSERDFAQIINNVLPDSIRVLGWSPVSEDFSARFSTKSRTYRYFFARRDLDLEAMTKGLDYIKGRHDFRNLCKMNCEEVDNFERVIMDAKIVTTSNVLENSFSPYSDYVSLQKRDQETVESKDDGALRFENEVGTYQAIYRQICYFEIKGQAFLWHQIRCIASVLLMIGKGLEAPEIVQELLNIEKNPGKPCYPFAPELPLVLHRCEYGNLRFGHSVQNLWRVCCDLECKWEELILASGRLRNGLVSLQDEAEVRRRDVLEFVQGIKAERKRKRSRNKEMQQDSDNDDINSLSGLLNEDGDDIISWHIAKALIYKHTGMKPNADGPTVQIHVPLMMRGKGTTYEEKIKAILSADDIDGKGGSKRRRELYEQNIKKKKLTKKEDAEFYNRMAQQGGSGL